MRKILYILLLFCVPLFGGAQEQYVDTVFHDNIDRTADDFVIASLVIADPGNQYFHSVFGHASLRMQCPTYNLDYVFTYIAIQQEESFLVSYFKGDLQMGLVAEETSVYVQNEFRSLKEYPLVLPWDVKQALWRILDEAAYTEGVTKQYNPITGSCALMTFYFLQNAIQNCGTTYQLTYEWDQEFHLTIRELLRRYTYNVPWTGFLYSTLVGASSYVDQPHIPFQQKLLYPAQLIKLLTTAKLNGISILSNDYKTITVVPTTITTPFLTPVRIAILVFIITILCTIFSLLLKNTYMWIISYLCDYTLLLFISFLSICLCYIWIGTHLPYTAWNWLLIPFNPILVFLWHWRCYWAFPYAIIIVLWASTMLLVPHMLVDPAYIILAFSVAIILLKQSPYIQNHWFVKSSTPIQ